MGIFLCEKLYEIVFYGHILLENFPMNLTMSNHVYAEIEGTIHDHILYQAWHVR